MAGPAALIVSKVIKVAERRDQPHRLRPKDGLDVLRLLRAVDTASLAQRFGQLASNGLAGEVVEQTVRDLRELAAGPEDLLPVLAADAEIGLGDRDEIKMSMVALVDELLGAFEVRPTASEAPESGERRIFVP
ncbi:hypothetical protein [Kibdelosporangium aridum]|uniref:hypothetical protein n=1 Tax=Kibdelosporangium aridum TaxID=2030 RepID=UPI00068EA95D